MGPSRIATSRWLGLLTITGRSSIAARIFELPLKLRSIARCSVAGDRAAEAMKVK